MKIDPIVILGGWQPMGAAPRDGTVVETMNVYGLAPSYGLAKWSTTLRGRESPLSRPAWASVDRDGSYCDDESTLYWRPFTGNADNYVDPTQGAQETPEYWKRHL